MHILEIVKIEYLICLQFRYTEQTKNIVLKISLIIQRRSCFPANGYQKVKFRDIVEIWKEIKTGSFFLKIFVKSQF